MTGMTGVFWLEQTEADLPPRYDWLSPEETLQLAQLRYAKRRRDWLLGRWTAKRSVAICLGIPQSPAALSRIGIRAAASGAPMVSFAKDFAGQLNKINISISHAGGHAVCAVVLSEITLGCDIEKVEPRSNAFVGDYFTAQEQEMVATNPPSERARISTLIWSAKESALKALQSGLRLDTRSVDVSTDGASSATPGWSPFQARYANVQTFEVWWKEDEGFVRTLVSAAKGLNQPIQLSPPETDRKCSWVA